MDNQENLVSIIVPVYNVFDYLSMCVESLLRQTYENIEIILVDDGSTDDSGKLCDSYSEKNHTVFVVHKANGGLSDARNVGIQNAHGTYITFVDSDDWVADNYVELLLATLKKSNSDISIAKLLQTDTRNEDNFVAPEGNVEIYNTEAALSQYLYQYFSTSANAKMYRRTIFDNLTFPVGKLYEDLETIYIAITKASKVAFCDSYVYKYYFAISIFSTRYTSYRLYNGLQ